MYGILKNASMGPLAVPAFGILLPSDSSFELSDMDDLQRVRLTAEIKILLVAGDLEIYNAVAALVSPEGIELWIQDQLGTRPRFEAYNAADSATFTSAAEAAQPLDTTSVETPNTTLNEGGAYIDIHFDGAIDIQAEVSVAAVSGSGLSGVDVWLELNDIFIPGTLRSTVLHAGEGSSVSTGRSSLAVMNDDKIAIIAQRTSGSLSWKYPASGCRLRLRRVE